ncbi:glycosyltransferase family 4 protein [Sphingomonas sp. BN140010]|uniref:Glycosyltransferase family 4 protein n=1 Tax=Sphingomonas arvum TaxID=2992113 RepID=A0ABT3JET1_9SPHN|nr:glycosyltransferase family 4 protein [Sphingomonas sp. BN140010]MCW3797519.1 glycosyltransferase family 4 protein [Sphingomonas sp. BN140010]
MKVIAYTKYDREAASTRQRLLQYLPAFTKAGIEVEYRPLLGDDYVRSLATGERPDRKAIARAYARRWRQLHSFHDADIVWVYAELFPWLPASGERLAFRPGLPVVYDMDDAFFVPYDANPRAAVRHLLAGKLRPLIGGAAACTCGNNYLADYAKPLCDRTLVVPTVVDTDRYVAADRSCAQPLTVGWIGSPSTFAQLGPVLPLLADLGGQGKAAIKIVGAGARAASQGFPGLSLIRWEEATEVAEVQSMDIGIMPLTDDAFVRGKSGYKLIQYMACGLPVIASPVGVNREIVQHGVTGYLASTVEDWREALQQLIHNPDLRCRMGAAGRRRAVERYSLSSQAPRLIELFHSLARGG